MWFTKVLGQLEDGSCIPVYADLGENYIFGTTFFDYFNDAPTFDIYDLTFLSESVESETPMLDEIEHILDVISKEKKAKKDIAST